ncbi:hypothetical protein EDD11_004645 [Mortierella claussenii]|nr:hypothetical protein EDD11_004645 [Mortierella claussenii]
MDWSPSVSVDDSEVFSSTTDITLASSSPSTTSSLIDIFCSQQRREYVDPHLTEHIADLCMLKLQQASSGRHHSLLRQVQLTCMLHRIRMQAFMRPVMAGYLHHHHHQQHQQQQQQVAFEQDMSASQPGYEWAQDSSLGPNQMASALSFDMLLNMGAPSTVSSASSVSGSSASSDLLETDQSMFVLSQPQQHHSLSSIPLVSFPSDYSTGSSDVSLQQGQSISQDLSHHPTSISLSSIPASPAVPSLAHQQLLSAVGMIPQQTYYELLMAANPNEPLSQLLSTSATTITSAASESSSAYAILDSSLPESIRVVSASSLEESSMDGPRVEHILSPVAATFALAAFPVASGPATSVQEPAHQQTVPLTTREIIDALSGQFPIQPVSSTATEAHPADVVIVEQSVLRKDSKVALAVTTSPMSSTLAAASPEDPTSVLSSIQSAESLNDSRTCKPEVPSMDAPKLLKQKFEESEVIVAAPTLYSQPRHDESWDSDNDMLSPPPLCHQDDEDESLAATTVEKNVDSQAGIRESSVDIDMADISLSSPPPSPSKSTRSPKRTKSSPSGRRPSRPQTRRSRAKSEQESLMARLHAVQETVPEHVQDNLARTMKRRRASEDDTSSSCSSPESSPPSPRTPPPLSESHCAMQQSSGQGQENCVNQLLEDQQQHRHSELGKEHELDSSKRSKIGPDVVDHMRKSSEPTTGLVVVEGMSAEAGQGDAGVLSPSLLTRYATRQSMRILRRTSSRIQSATSCGANTHQHHANVSEPALLSSSSKVTAA